MAWYNSSWLKRKAITLTGGASGSISDYQLKLTVTFDADMKSDFSDLRFTKADGTTLLDAWMESHVASTSAIVWVETNTPANTVEATIYMYYGNSVASSDWKIADTFIFGDEFDSLAAWSQIGTPSVSGGVLTLNSGDGVYKDVSFGSLYCVHGRIKDANSGTDSTRFFIGTDNTAGNSGPYIGWRTAAKIYEYSGGWAQIGTYVTDTYDRIEMRNVNPTTQTWDAYVDGVLGLSSAGFYNNVTPSRVILTANSVNCYADWIFVRKYVANPATYGFEAEEDKPSGVIPVIMRYYRNMRNN